MDGCKSTSTTSSLSNRKMFKLDIPEKIRDSRIIKIGVKVNKEVMDFIGMENVKIYFRDPSANVQFISPPFKIKETVFNAVKETFYDLKSKVTTQLADDPMTKCMDYEIFGQYENCKDEEMKDKFQSLIGCVPIWFTDQPGYCGQRMISEKTAAIIYDLLSGVEAGSFISKCLPPCTTVEYNIEHKITSVTPKGNEALFIVIDQNVQVARTSFVPLF